MGAKRKQKASRSRNPAQWFEDHALELCVVVITLMTAVCYFIGRAGLVGWYDAAGVPQLVFSWPAQDVVIRGVTDEDIWLLVLLAFGGSGLYFLTLSLVSALISKQAAKVRDLRDRGETVWSRGERRLCVWAARRARLAHSPSAALATVRWRTLGKRGQLRRKARKAVSKPWQPPVGVVAMVLAACVLIAVTFGYASLILLLHRAPYANGVRAFSDQYLAATGQEPPLRQLPSWAQLQVPMSEASKEAAILRGRRLLAGYPFVRVTPKDADSGGEVDCGWLVQASGGALVLLNSQGLLFRSFGDAGFSWKPVAPDACVKGAAAADPARPR